MPIVGGLDIHRKQLTFDYLDTVTGEVRRGQIAPAGPGAPAGLAGTVRRPGRRRVRDGGVHGVAVCHARSWPRPGLPRVSGEAADTAAARGRKRHAKTDKTDSWHLRTLLAEERLPECWIPPAQILEYRALLETVSRPAAEHTARVQRIRAVFFHQGAPPAGRGRAAHRAGLAALRAAAAAHLSPPGSCRSPPPWTCSPPSRPAWRYCARSCGLPPAPDRREGAGRAAVRRRAGHRAGADVLAGRGGPVLLLPQGGPVHRAGHHRLVLGPQGPARAAVPAGTAGAALGAV